MNLSDVEKLPEVGDMVSPHEHVSELLRVIRLVGRAFKEYGDGIGRLLLVILLELIRT